MKIDEGFLARMREATQLLQSEGPMAATAAIQRALHGTAPIHGNDGDNGDEGAAPAPMMKDINPRAAEAAEVPTPPGAGLLASLRERTRANWPGAGRGEAVQDVDATELREHDVVAGRGRIVSGSCTNRAGTRGYKLYIPSAYCGEPLPLVVMLHGCTQNPDDFAAGTQMNAHAEDNHCFVVYPAQAQSANSSNCWNWFKPGDQRRDQGEPSIIADITRKLMRDYRIDSTRVYVAGLSAGGAMAAVLGATYPDLYAAVGIHSGLPHGAAHDVPSAFGAMKSRKGKTAGASTPFRHTMPVIVFHGDRDTTVHPGNGQQALTQCAGASEGCAEISIKVEKGASPNGRSFTRTIHQDGNGKSMAEHWAVHGAGHAWSGGSNQGSYTDPSGPDASREMLRFFFSHSLNAPKQAM